MREPVVERQILIVRRLEHFQEDEIGIAVFSM